MAAITGMTAGQLINAKNENDMELGDKLATPNASIKSNFQALGERDLANHPLEVGLTMLKGQAQKM